MGFVQRYWREAEEKQIPHYRRLAIVELQTGSARVQRRGLANVSDQEFPELPLEFSAYEEAFAWVERKLTQHVPDEAIGCAHLYTFTGLDKKGCMGVE